MNDLPGSPRSPLGPGGPCDPSLPGSPGRPTRVHAHTKIVMISVFAYKPKYYH